MERKITETFYPCNREEWRNWLRENHQTKQSIWLLQYKKNSGKPSLSWSEAVDEALCFGWIDSTRKSVDDESFVQFFCKRKPQSTWSKINKDKVEELMAAGLMTQAGIDIVELAKTNGAWNKLDDIDNMTIPEDLQVQFDSFPGSSEYFQNLSNSVKKNILYWITSAKRTGTRNKRIQEIVNICHLKQKPGPF